MDDKKLFNKFTHSSSNMQKAHARNQKLIKHTNAELIITSQNGINEKKNKNNFDLTINHSNTKQKKTVNNSPNICKNSYLKTDCNIDENDKIKKFFKFETCSSNNNFFILKNLHVNTLLNLKDPRNKFKKTFCGYEHNRKFSLNNKGAFNNKKTTNLFYHIKEKYIIKDENNNLNKNLNSINKKREKSFEERINQTNNKRKNNSEIISIEEKSTVNENYDKVHNSVKKPLINNKKIKNTVKLTSCKHGETIKKKINTNLYINRNDHFSQSNSCKNKTKINNIKNFNVNTINNVNIKIKKFIKKNEKTGTSLNYIKKITHLPKDKKLEENLSKCSIQKLFNDNSNSYKKNLYNQRIDKTKISIGYSTMRGKMQSLSIKSNKDNNKQNLNKYKKSFTQEIIDSKYNCILILSIISNWGNKNQLGINSIEFFDKNNKKIKIIHCRVIGGSNENINRLFNEKIYTVNENDMWLSDIKNLNSDGKIKLYFYIKKSDCNKIIDLEYINYIMIWNYNGWDKSKSIKQIELMSKDEEIFFYGIIPKGEYSIKSYQPYKVKITKKMLKNSSNKNYKKYSYYNFITEQDTEPSFELNQVSFNNSIFSKNGTQPKNNKYKNCKIHSILKRVSLNNYYLSNKNSISSAGSIFHMITSRSNNKENNDNHSNSKEKSENKSLSNKKNNILKNYSIKKILMNKNENFSMLKKINNTNTFSLNNSKTKNKKKSIILIKDTNKTNNKLNKKSRSNQGSLSEIPLSYNQMMPKNKSQSNVFPSSKNSSHKTNNCYYNTIGFEKKMKNKIHENKNTFSFNSIFENNQNCKSTTLLNFFLFKKIRINFLSNYGNTLSIGLTGLNLIDKNNKKINIESAIAVGALPKDLCTVYNNINDHRIFENIFNGVNNTIDENDMWLTLLNPKPYIEICFEKSMTLSKIEIWNFNEPLSLDKGVKDIEIIFDSDENKKYYATLWKGLGIEYYDYYQKISYNNLIKNSIFDKTRYIKNKKNVSELPIGFVFKLVFISNYGDKEIISLKNIEFYNERNTKLNKYTLINDNIGNISNKDEKYKKYFFIHEFYDFRKNEDSICQNLLFICFDEIVQIKYIKIINTRNEKLKNSCVKNLQIYCDDILIFEGTVNQKGESIILFDKKKKSNFKNIINIDKKESKYQFKEKVSDKLCMLINLDT